MKNRQQFLVPEVLKFLKAQKLAIFCLKSQISTSSLHVSFPRILSQNLQAVVVLGEGDISEGTDNKGWVCLQRL